MTSGGTTDDAGVFLGDGTTLSQVSREGQAAPDGNGVLVPGLFSIAVYGVNELGQVAFPVDDSNWHFRRHHRQLSGFFSVATSPLKQIAAHAVSPLPDGNGRFSVRSSDFNSARVDANVNASRAKSCLRQVSTVPAAGGADDVGHFLVRRSEC